MTYLLVTHKQEKGKGEVTLRETTNREGYSMLARCAFYYLPLLKSQWRSMD